MPIYEYRCTSCGHTFEAIQRFSDPPMTGCSQCPGRLEKLISRTSFQLKGGGWFTQDYGASKPAASDGGGKKKEAGTDPAPGASDPKPAGGCGSGSCGCAS